MTNIDRQQVRKVAHLARLDITEAEETQFTAQLSSILDYFEQLSELDTTDVLPTTRAIDISNITRADRLEPTLERDVFLQAAPEPDGEFFKVPQILSSD